VTEPASTQTTLTTPVNPSEPVSTPSPRPANPAGPGQQQPVNPSEPITTPVGNPGVNPTEPTAVDYSALAMPEGYQLEEAALADFRRIAAEHKLPLEAANSMLEFQAILALDAKNAAAAEEAEIARRGEAELRADPEFGGAKYAESLSKAKRVVNEFWDKQGAEALINSKLANSGWFVRGLIKVAQATAEAPLVASTGVAPRDNLRARYPTMPDEFFNDSKAA
jgi:hypothetical protein